MAKMSPRLVRVADQLQRELAVLIQQEVKDPRLGMVSVTGVDVSRDLGYADVYITTMDTARTLHDHKPAAPADAGGEAAKPDETAGSAEKAVAPEPDSAQSHKESVRILNNAAGFLRSLLGRRLALRTIPKLRFHYDESIERGRYLSSLIDSAVAADRERQE